MDFGRALPRCRTVCITGGESYITQNKALAGSYDILVATPGRLTDQMNSGRIVLSNLEVLVLDEADRMLDMGFADDVMAIAKKLPRTRQTVCFTATLSDDVQRLSAQLQQCADHCGRQAGRRPSADRPAHLLCR
jgi:superfamily II DNA/RNA helicase